MAERTVLVKLQADVAQYRQGLNQAAAQTKDMGTRLETFAAKNEQNLTRVGTAGMAMGAALAAGVGLSVRAAVQWESAWAGVTKTVDGSAKQMAVLEGELRNLAKTLPASHQQIAAVAEAAGQLGVKREAIAGFTKVMIDLGETTNLTADEAATAIAQMANVMGTAPDEIDNLGAALVALGNDGASTERQIVQMAQRISGAAATVGLAESDVLAIANAVASMGIEVEAGGSSVSRVLTDMSKAAQSGGAVLEVFAQTADMSAQEFSTAFLETPAEAFAAFIGGLGGIQEAGGNVFAVLDDIGLADVRVSQSLLGLASSGDLLTNSLTLGAEAWEANTALVQEAEKRYATTEAKMQIARNAVNDLGIELGAVLLPALAGVAGGVADLVGWVGGLPGPVKTAITVLGTLGATVGLIGGAAFIAAPKIAALRLSLVELGMSADRAEKTMGRLGTVMKAGAIAGAVAGVALAVDQLYRASVDAPPGVNALTESLLEFIETGTAGGQLARVMGADFADLAEKIDMASRNRLVELGKDIVFLGESQKDILGAREEIEALDQSLAGLVQSGNEVVAAEFFRRWAEDSGRSVEDLSGDFEAYQEALAGARVESELAAGGVEGVGAAAAGAVPEVQELTEAQQALESALSSFADPLSVYTEMVQASAEAVAANTESGEDSWADYADTVELSLDAVAAKLEEENQARLDWRDNLVKVAQTAGADVAQILAGMGEEGVRLTAQMADGSEAEVQRMAEALRSNAALGGAGAARELDAQLQVMAAIAASGGKATVESLAAQLNLGTAQVAAIAQRYGVELAAGISPMLQALGKKGLDPASLARQDAAMARRRYADGGVEDHTAQIAPAGAWRVWAEPETGGEAYIPLAPSKRQRSLKIWQETGRRLQAFAAGGFHTAQDVPRPPGTRPFGPPISTAADGTMLLAYQEAARFVAENAFTGSIAGAGAGRGNINAELLRRFDAWNASLSGRLRINSGYRSSAEQARLYARYLAGQGPVAAPPGRSRHERSPAEAIDYGPATWALTGTARRFGLKAPVPSEAWHLEAMAKGGILNPHVRDRGGPLLPGWTLNGTRRPEMVVPMADGGFHWNPASKVVPSAAAAATVGAGGGAADLQALLAAWDRHLKQLEQAAERQELLAAVQAQEAGAVQRLLDFDVAAYRDAERASVEALIDSLEVEAKAREDDYQRRREINNNLFELGRLSTRDHLINLDLRMAREEQYSDEWTALYRERERVVQDLADAQADALGKLNRLLDEQAQVQGRMAESSRRFAEQQSQVQGRLVEAEASMYTRRSAAARDFAEEQQRILDSRRDALAGWARLDELVTPGWGNTLGQLLGNARAQAEQFTEWMAALADARARGVSEAVIGALGLDEGPQALGALRQFSEATQDELDALNVAVSQRTTVAAGQVRREQSAGYGQVAAELAQAHARYTAELAQIQTDYNEAVAQAQEDLARLQDEFLAEQQELAVEFAAIGSDQGRSYGEAVAEGVRSQIPAVAAAVAELQALIGQQAALAGRLASGGASPPMSGSPIGGSTGWSNWGGVRGRTYDAGGWLQPGYTLAYNGTGSPERVLTAQQAAGTTTPQVLDVTVYVGDRQLTDMVRVEVNGTLSQHRTAAAVTGARG